MRLMGEPGLIRVKSIMTTPIISVLAIRMVRCPNIRSSGRLLIFMSMAAPAVGMVSKPACHGW